MKKTKPTSQHKTEHKKKVVDPIDETGLETPVSEENLAEDQFAVTGREDEASSSGRRVEPIINDEEGNAEKLVEEGLHGYLHVTPKNSHQGR